MQISKKGLGGTGGAFWHKNNDWNSRYFWRQVKNCTSECNFCYNHFRDQQVRQQKWKAPLEKRSAVGARDTSQAYLQSSLFCWHIKYLFYAVILWNKRSQCTLIMQLNQSISSQLAKRCQMGSATFLLLMGSQHFPFTWALLLTGPHNDADCTHSHSRKLTCQNLLSVDAESAK